MPWLTSDIYSKLNRDKCYGKKGDEVIVISDRAGVLIVRLIGAKDGFAVLQAELTSTRPGDQPPDPEPSAPDTPIAKAAARRKTKPSTGPANQTSLF